MAGQRFEAKRASSSAEAAQLCFHGLFWLGLAGLAPRRQFFCSRADLLHAARSRVSSTLALKQGEGTTARPTEGGGSTPASQTRRSGCMRPRRPWVWWGARPDARLARPARPARPGRPSPSMVAVGRVPGTGVLVGCQWGATRVTVLVGRGSRFPMHHLCSVHTRCTHDAHQPRHRHPARLLSGNSMATLA